MSTENKIPQYYWDTCVLIAYLGDEQLSHGKSTIDDIGQILTKCQKGLCKIYCSTITIAEITRANLKGGQDLKEFMKLWESGIVPISPDPHTMQIASELRSAIYFKTKANRQLHTVDSIHLATAITLVESYGVTLDAFHTFDKGGKRGGDDGRGVPLLGYETWCHECKDDITVKKAIQLNRCRPELKEPPLPF